MAYRSEQLALWELCENHFKDLLKCKRGEFGLEESAMGIFYKMFSGATILPPYVHCHTDAKVT